ncbi:MAG: hypothetical protein ACK4NY_08200 [Spirosomataceae bacterium]
MKFKNFTKWLVFVIVSSVYGFSCTKFAKHQENDLKIILLDSSSLLDIDPRETKYLYEIVSPLVVNFIEKEAKDSTSRAHIFQPILIRLDNRMELPFKLEVETFSGDKDNPKVIQKSIDELFSEDNLNTLVRTNKRFFSNFEDSEVSLEKMNNYVTETSNDSLLILNFDTKVRLANIANKQVQTFNNIESLRNFMRFILQENPKTSFILLVGGNFEDKESVEQKLGEVAVDVKIVNPPKALRATTLKKSSIKSYSFKASPQNLPPPLKTEGVKVEDVKDANIKEMKVPKKYN